MKNLVFLVLFISMGSFADGCQSGKRQDLNLPIELDGEVANQSYVSLCNIKETQEVSNLANQLKTPEKAEDAFFKEIKTKFSKVYDEKEWLVIGEAFLVGSDAYLVLGTNKRRAFTYLKLRYTDGKIILNNLFAARDSFGIFLMSIDSSSAYSGKRGNSNLKLFDVNQVYIAANISNKNSELFIDKFKNFDDAMLKNNFKYVEQFFGEKSKNKIDEWLAEMPNDDIKSNSLRHYVVPHKVEKVINIGNVSVIYFSNKKEVGSRLYFSDGVFYNFMIETSLDSALWLLIDR